MATLGTNVLTLADWAKRVDPNGKTPRIAELLSQTNEILTDMGFMEGNLVTGHQHVIRTGLPTVAWRLYNQGTPKSKSSTAQITEQTGMLEARSEVDTDMAELGGDVSSFRLSEASSFIESMNQEAASTLIYGNGGVSPEEFTGLAVRYSSLTATNAQNILDAAGTGSDNTSVWLVVWGANTTFGIFPKGSKAGLEHKNLGEVDAFDDNNNRFRAYADLWKWKMGLAIKDWRYVVRIANVDISDLIANGAAAASLTELMIKAIHRIPTMKAGKAAFYMNRTCFEMLDIQRRAHVEAGGGLTYQNVDGQPVMHFRGIPIRKVDAIIETEARVV